MAFVWHVSMDVISTTPGIGALYPMCTTPGIGTPGITIPGIVPIIMVDGILWDGALATGAVIGIPIGRAIILITIITLIGDMVDTMDMVPVFPRSATAIMDVPV